MRRRSTRARPPARPWPLTRRQFVQTTAMAGAAMFLPWKGIVRRAWAQVPGGTQDPKSIPKFVAPLVKPPAVAKERGSNRIRDLYDIAIRQFEQQILPPGHPKTTVWSYGPGRSKTTGLASGFFYPAFTIENTWNKETQVVWRNQLVDAMGNYLPHLLPIDQTLHWANPPGGLAGRDGHGASQDPYTGPVPMVTHVHGAHTYEDSDGYAEAWYLPDAVDIPAGYARTGTFFDYFNTKYMHNWELGAASFKYPNDQAATTLWYHDHSLGMTRANVYAGPAGFYLIRGGPGDVVLDSRDSTKAVLPGPAPGVGDHPFGTYYEIPIAIQDRSFNVDGSLFYPDTRAFFEGLNPMEFGSPYLDIPYAPDMACGGLPSDVAPIWQPEFFGNVMVVNGQTWPFLEVERRRYRFRLLNGCNSRFLILDFSQISGVEVWQIGAEGGFLPAAVNISYLQNNRLLMSPAERADVIVDFTNVPVGSYILANIGPDEPFGGGEPPDDFDTADPDTTGQVMLFKVVSAKSADSTTPPQFLQLPAVPSVFDQSPRQLSLNEEESQTVFVEEDISGNLVLACGSGEPFGPTAALLGTYDGSAEAKLWSDAITENPALGTTETWELHNFTADAHPIHIHQVQFQVVGREPFGGGTSAAGSNDPLPTETGYKDTVTAYPGEITRVQAKFDLPGFYVWHCHIVEHEDNEMMRPFHVGPIPPDAPQQ